MPRNYAELADYGSTLTLDEGVAQDWFEQSDPSQQGWTIQKPLGASKLSNRSKEINRENDAIEAEIATASFILNIEAEADDPDFIPYSTDTLKRAVMFLRRLALHAHSCGFSGIGVPEFLPSAKGSIDLLWRNDSRQLLMNFSNNLSDRISFYGRKGKSEISGRFDAEDFRPELVYWLAS